MKTAKRFHSGLDCVHGHVDPPRYVSSGNCALCQDETRKKRIALRGPTKQQVLAAACREAREKARIAGAIYFLADAPCKRGHYARRFVSNNTCVECNRVMWAERYANDEDFRKKCLRESIAWKRSVPVEVRREKDRANYRRNPDKLFSISMRKWRAKRATPAWLDEAQLDAMRQMHRRARELTEATSIPHDVDHIVPLRGRNVSGLNVPWNLRILTQEDNRRKQATMPEPEELLGHTTRSIYYVPVDG